jgi:hypothetical protein
MTMKRSKDVSRINCGGDGSKEEAHINTTAPLSGEEPDDDREGWLLVAAWLTF